MRDQRAVYRAQGGRLAPVIAGYAGTAGGRGPRIGVRVRRALQLAVAVRESCEAFTIASIFIIVGPVF